MTRKRKRKRRRGLTTFKAGLIGAILVSVFSYLAYTKFANPFASPFTIHAVFSSANGLRPDSFVRIAGVNVGKVTTVAPEPTCKVNGKSSTACQAADVTMEIDPVGLPIHKDATFWIRPRIFLEGNFFVDLQPGTPEAPTVSTGYTFPIGQGREPVQLDQVLTSLQSDTRHNLQILLREYGSAVKQAGPAYNASINYWLPAYKYSAIVAHDALGIQPHDLSNAIYNGGTVAGALDAHPRNLQNLITDFNTTAKAFARENVALRNTVAELPRTLSTAIPAFNALNAAFPPLRALSRALLPGVRSTGPMVTASLPFITQLRLLVRRQELRGLTSDLSVTVPALAQLTLKTIPLMRDGVRPASSCIANVVIPWTHLTVPDPNFNAKNGFPPHPVYVEAADFLPGLAGESRDFDANGPYIRILGALGNTVTQSLSASPIGSTLTGNQLIGGALAPINGAQPALPPNDAPPPFQPNVPCETQPPITDLSAPSTGPPPTFTAVLPTAAQKRQRQQERSALIASTQGTPKQRAARAAADEATAKRTSSWPPLLGHGSGW